MGTGQIHKEIFVKKIKEQIKLLELEEERGLSDYLDTPWIKHILLDSINFYYKDEKTQ